LLDLNQERIFLKREDALQFCKKNPDNCRFKSFKSKKEAEEFSFGLLNGSLSLTNSNTPLSVIKNKLSSQFKLTLLYFKI
jgi:hypothetical protein